MTAQTLTTIDSSAKLPEFRRLVRQHASHLLIAAFLPDREQDRAIRDFTDGRIIRVSQAMGKMRPYAVSKRFREITGPLTGLALTPVNDSDSVFVQGNDGTEVDEIITIGGRGHFIRTRIGGCDTYLLGCTDPLDIDRPVSESPSIRHYFSSLFPILMFIRQAFGTRCWHQNRAQASLTIDDPLLVDRYGFVHYRELLQFMDRYNFFTTIAFIPWNFRRTSPSVARLVQKRKDRVSICVHGCDHTRHEFASSDYGELNGRIKLATIRMTEHQRLTNIPFVPVMVFPQGAFSSPCMQVLKANNYLAAVNLETTPVHPFDAVPLKCFLEPAIVCFGNFPLFERRYPENIADIALDLFLCKPALILEHHSFFQGQSQDAIQAVKRVNALDAGIHWTSLDRIACRSYLQKQENGALFSVRAFTRKAAVSNDSPEKREYRFFKEESDQDSIQTVTVNGRTRPYDYEGSLLSLSLTLNPRSTAEIEIVYRDPFPHIQVEDSLYQNLKVFSRRRLSEIRDNYLSRSRAALAVANRMKKVLA
jgi:hypothetical protein